MKLNETTIDDEKENTCNGNGLLEKTFVKKSLPSEPSNGNHTNDSSSSPSDVGDLLVEDTTRHEEEVNHNGNKADDSTSISSSSSFVVATDFQQDLSDEDIHLRLSDEDEPESNCYFTSSPFPKADEDKKKSEDKDVSVSEEKSNIDNKKTINTSESEISVSSVDKNSSTEKSDDLEHLILDLNEQSKSAIESENKNVTISDLRQEIEDLIKNNDDADAKNNENSEKSNENEKKDTSNESITIDEHEIEIPKDDSITSSEIVETTNINNKTSESAIDTDETSATNITETKETDNSECQKINDSEKIKTESSYHNKNPETETETENNTETVIDNNKDENLELMEIDKNDENDKRTILIDDDVDMKEDDDKKLNEDENNENEKDSNNKDAVEEIKIETEETKEEAKVSPEEKSSLKRRLDNNEDGKDVKKPKINGLVEMKDKKQYVRLDSFKEFMSKKEISSLTRAELEQFCLQKMCEAITQTSKIAELNRKVQQQQVIIDNLRTKTGSIQKQIKDLEVVHSKVFHEIITKKIDGNSDVTPVKITRSVGLQVNMQLVPNRIRPATVNSYGSVIPSAKRRIQRNSLPVKLSLPQTIMPPPSKPPVQRSPNQPKTIKTILPKIYPNEPPKDPSLLESYLQTPSTSKSPTSPKKTTAPVASTSTEVVTKVIDLTDEDDAHKTNNNIRLVTQQHLQTTVTNTSSVPRLTYLVPGNQNGQQVLLTTTTSTNARSGQVRPAVMFKPVAPGIISQVVPGQRLNIVRPSATGITVLPTTSAPTIRAGQQIRFTAPIPNTRPQPRAPPPARHPAPLPGPPAVQPSQPNWKAMPPRPTLKISRVGDGIVLSWRMQTNKDMSLYEDIGSYQLYAYQETNSPPSTDMWRKVGDVKALALPMACTLTQFTDGNKYHFAVRAVDVKSRVGPFSHPEQIALP